MLIEGNLIYFKTFYFPNGKSAPKSKYLIVLKKDKDLTVLASLPTRVDNVPSERDLDNGCIEFNRAEHGFEMSCFRISPDDDFLEGEVENPFHTNTHLYGAQVRAYTNEYFDLYPYADIDYEIVGRIKDDYYSKIIDCFKNSKAVRRGYRRILNA